MSPKTKRTTLWSILGAVVLIGGAASVVLSGSIRIVDCGINRAIAVKMVHANTTTLSRHTKKLEQIRDILHQQEVHFQKLDDDVENLKKVSTETLGTLKEVSARMNQSNLQLQRLVGQLQRNQ